MKFTTLALTLALFTNEASSRGVPVTARVAKKPKAIEAQR